MADLVDAVGRLARSFGGNTPAEVIAGFTDGLLRPTPEGKPDIWPTLRAAGWTYERDGRGNEHARHPDGITTMERSATLDSDHFAWTAEVALPTGLGGHNRLWHAYYQHPAGQRRVRRLRAQEPHQRPRPAQLRITAIGASRSATLPHAAPHPLNSATAPLHAPWNSPCPSPTPRPPTDTT